LYQTAETVIMQSRNSPRQWHTYNRRLIENNGAIIPMTKKMTLSNLKSP